MKNINNWLFKQRVNVIALFLSIILMGAVEVDTSNPSYELPVTIVVFGLVFVLHQELFKALDKKGGK